MTRAAEGEPPLSAKPHPLGPGDRASLAALHAVLFPAGWPEADFARFLNAPGVFGFGFGRVEPTGFILCRVVADEAEVLTFGVAPAARQRGVGRRLLWAAMDEAKRRGATCMFLEVAEDNLAARRLYEGARFFCVGRRPAYYPDARGGPVAGNAALVLRFNLCDVGP